MKIVQSTWVRYHHFDLARELNQMGYLERIFTCLPWWKASKESKEQHIPYNSISCNFLMQGTRHVMSKSSFYSPKLDGKLAVLQTKLFSKWVANNLPECDTYIGISGSGLHAGRLAKSRGAGYIMDRGSTQIRHADKILSEEYKRWNLPYEAVHPWLIENEESEAFEADLITVPSHFVKGTFVGQGMDPSKICVVPYGVSLKEFYPTSTPQVNTFRLLFVGQFSLRKGIPYLLEAFKAFKHPNKELVIVGNVSEEIRPIIKTMMDDKITFVGAVSRDEVKKYMSVAHALVLPSVEEGLALVQAQAMACGCPVIATPNTGSETLFQHEVEGLIVEARNSAALTQAFIRLADDEALRIKMSKACIEKAKSLGGWKTYADGVVEAARSTKTFTQ